ncbi:unnamed protein product [Parajaminaea phylloscopi]
MSFSLATFADSLQACASAPAAARTQAYQDILTQLLSQPRRQVSAEELLQACDHYLETTVFSDLNSAGGGLVVGRNVLSAFDEAVRTAGQAADASMPQDNEQEAQSHEAAIRDHPVQRDVLEMALSKVQPRVLSFEEQATAIRFHLADVHEAMNDWSEAAGVLQGIPLDSGHRSVSDIVKLRIYVRIVRLLLEADDAIAADAYLKRASMVVHAVPGTNVGASAVVGPSATMDTSDGVEAASESAATTTTDLKEGRVLGLQYKLCQARIYDAQRRFAEAAVRFQELSYVAEIDPEERTMMLSAAVTAAILAPAGPLRSRILSTLIRDERSSSLAQATILSKVFLDHIVRPHEAAAFEKMLQPHQKAELARTGNESEMLRLEATAAAAEGATASTSASSSSQQNVKSGPTTVLDRAIMEHNVLASSRLYMNITLAGLGSLLNLTPTGAETIVRRMIVQGRLRAEIDQVDGVLTFLESTDEGPTAGGLGVSTGGQTAEAGPAGPGNYGAYATPVGEGDGLTRRWDAQIAKTASGLEEVCVRIAAHTNGEMGSSSSVAVSG